MEYPKNWEAEVTAWGDDIAPEEDIIVIKDEFGETKAHKVKGIDWLATAKANWKKLALAGGTALVVVTAIVVLVKVLTGKKD